MAGNHITLIMQRLNKIVAEDRIRKYSTVVMALRKKRIIKIQIEMGDRKGIFYS